MPDATLERDAALFAPIARTGRGFYLTVAVLGLAILWGAIAFGDLSDSGGEVAKLAKSPRAFRVGEELGTKPKVIYLSETEAHGRA